MVDLKTITSYNVYQILEKVYAEATPKQKEHDNRTCLRIQY